jgi:hypothetical protein
VVDSNWGTGQHQNHSPTHCYAQDIEYNELDEEFLRSLGITKIDSPHGFEAVESHGTFAYTPGAEAAVSAIVLDKDPPLLLSNELTEYVPQAGEYAPTMNALNVAIHRYTSDGKTSVPIPGPNDEELHNYAFMDQRLYGHFVAELPAGDHGVLMRGGDMPHNPHEQGEEGDEHGGDGGDEEAGAGYEEPEQYGYDQGETQHGAYGHYGSSQHPGGQYW